MQRYFVQGIEDGKAILDDNQTHHILHVMRMTLNDTVEICYDHKAYLGMITSINPLEISIDHDLQEDHELKNPVTLLYCLPKGDKLDLVIQKATELGVHEIILVQSERCVTKFKKEDYAKKLLRFNKIASEACEQSKRDALPVISKIIDYKDISKYDFDHKFIAYEKEKDLSFYEKLAAIKPNESISILIGSEGGFSIPEVEYALKNGYYSVSLGKRILRSETAVFYGLSIIGFMLERK